MSTFYSITTNGNRVFDNTQNQACYATIFGIGGTNEGRFESYIKPDTFFELYIPLGHFFGSFKEKIDAEKYLDSVRKMGFKFDSIFQNELPRQLGKGWKISFDMSKCSKIEIKIGTYLIRFMWEILPAGFDNYYLAILKKYGKKISHFSLFKYAYFNYALFNQDRYYLGHALPKSYIGRNYEDNLKDKLREPFETVYQNLFSYKVLSQNISFPFVSNNNPHLPQSLQDSIDNLSKYLNNPQQELDK